MRILIDMFISIEIIIDLHQQVHCEQFLILGFLIINGLNLLHQIILEMFGIHISQAKELGLKV